MGERAPCPYCTRGSTALTKRGLLAYHNGRYGVPCPAGGLTVEEARAKRAFDDSTRNPRRKAPARPTVRHMVGGETGDVSPRDDLDDGEYGAYGSDAHEDPPRGTCTAPTPEAKP